MITSAHARRQDEQRQTAIARAEAVLARIAEAAGEAAPPLEVRRVADWPARVERKFDGTLLVVIAERRVRAAGDDELLGLLAHEYAHVEYDDPEPTVSRGRAVLGVVAAVAVVMAGMFGIAIVSGLLLGPIAVWAGLGVGLLVMLPVPLVAEALSRRRRFARTGRDSPWHELRADLRAVQLVGRQPVGAMLKQHAHPSRVDQRLNSIAPTHPSTEVRRAVIDQYDPADDPAEAAATALRSRREAEKAR